MKTLRTLAATVAMLLCCITASADAVVIFEVDGIWYATNDNSSLTVDVCSPQDGTKYTGDIEIPSRVEYSGNSWKINCIKGFTNCPDLTSVIIPNTVLYVYSAFNGSSNLASITCKAVNPPSANEYTFNEVNKETCIINVPASAVDAYKADRYWGEFKNVVAINNKVDSGTCGTNLTWTFYENGELIIDGVGAIPSYSYTDVPWNMYLYDIIKVIVKDGVTSIGAEAFADCSSLISIAIPESVKTIGNYTFAGCNSLVSVTIPKGITTIGRGTFYNCSNLISVVIPESVSVVENAAFYGCKSLSEVHIASIEAWCNIKFDSSNPLNYAKNLYFNGELLEELVIPKDVAVVKNFDCCESLISVILTDGVTSIGAEAFADCSSLASITLPESVTSIGGWAFENCSSLTSINIPEGVTSIGGYAFSNSAKEVVLKSTTPLPLTTSGIASSYTLFVVPAAAYNDYVTATYWKDLASQITIDDANARVKNVALTAEASKSALHMAIGDADLKYVTNLTISGSINSYDFMVMRNKMPQLRHLDLSDATIVYNAHEHYAGYHTEDNKFPGYGLYGCNLLSLVLPKNITAIGYNAMRKNDNLSEVTFFEGLISIETDAFAGCNVSSVVLPKGLTSLAQGVFYNCRNLTSVTLPEGFTTLGLGVFEGCEKLSEIELPKGLTTIGTKAFSGCTSLNEVVLPPTVQEIMNSAFFNCDRLTEIRIPSSVRSVGNSAFSGCSKLNDVYVYTVEPIDIGQGTFTSDGNNFIGTLHAPKVSYWDYYYDTQWSQFTSFVEFDEPYDNFYLQGDKVLDSETGVIEGEGDDAPDAEMGSNSGIIVEDDIEQDLGDVDIEHNGTNGGSIIVDGSGCVNTNELHFHINVTGGRWYFFCFPFDVRREDIVLENGADWVFRYYDGEERAHNGKGGWKNVTSDGNGNHLKAATGYIFQCSKDDVLILTAKNQKIKQEKKYNELVEHITQNAHDASWNFVGNPYLSYYEVTSDDYSAPITVWDGNKYIAIRPGDDDYQLAPFEAFFVQKPEGVANVDYSPERQMTYHQSQKAAAQARARRRTMPVDPDRLLVNITLGNGTDSDQTRVVFNNEAAMGYETACDAAKFESDGVAQLYTIDSRAVKYAINERPVAEGIVTMGYSVPAQGVYTLAAPRMDTPIYIKDNLTGTVHDFAEGNYEFASEAGTFDDRFTVIMKAGETGIENSEFNIQNSELYNVKGQRVENAEERGVYIKENRKVVKL